MDNTVNIANEIIKCVLIVILFLIIFDLTQRQIYNETFCESTVSNDNNNIGTVNNDNIGSQNNNDDRRVYFSNTKFYFLTVNNERRKHHIKIEFKEFSPIEINPVTGIPKDQSGATGFNRIIDKALRDQDITKPFQPFIILEDDASKYRSFPDYLDIPFNADLVYLGLTVYGWGHKINRAMRLVYSEDYNADYIKVNNMLATHAIMVCSPAGAAMITKCMMDSYYKNEPWDISLASSQPFYNIYALKIPLVYQDEKYGGREKSTKITVANNWFKKIPNDEIVHNSAPNLMNQK